jgi:hypothetical protein
LKPLGSFGIKKKDTTPRELAKMHNINFSIIKQYPNKNKFYRTILRNCVDYRIGKYILDCAQNKQQQKTIGVF